MNDKWPNIERLLQNARHARLKSGLRPTRRLPAEARTAKIIHHNHARRLITVARGVAAALRGVVETDLVLYPELKQEYKPRRREERYTAVGTPIGAWVVTKYRPAWIGGGYDFLTNEPHVSGVALGEDGILRTYRQQWLDAPTVSSNGYGGRGSTKSVIDPRLHQAAGILENWLLTPEQVPAQNLNQIENGLVILASKGAPPRSFP